METANTSHRFAGIVIGAVMIILVALVTIVHERSSSPEASALPIPTASASPLPSEPLAAAPVTVVNPSPVAVKPKQISPYKDGTYTATGSYMSPGGYDQITVTLTIANGIVTDASVTPGAGDGTSQRYQDRFISGYKPYVIGKSIATLSLSWISGSSLTPVGFNDAVKQIRAAAQS